jgi:hypothetical protein
VISGLNNIVASKWTKLLMGAVALLTVASLLLGFAMPSDALAWDNCPKGLVNDPYPGACRRYVDTNGDAICDLSQSKPVASTTTTQPVTTTTTETTSTTKVTAATGSLGTTTATSGEPPSGDCPLGPCIGCRACVSISIDVQDGASIAFTGAATVALASPGSGSDGTGTGSGTGGTAVLADSSTAGSTAADVTAQAGTTTGGSSILTHYLVAPIAIAFLLIYGVSFVLYKTKKIRITSHRKVWNVMLLGTFLVTGIFGLILTIQLDYTLPFTLPINLLFWHVEAGIAMTLISLFHMGWHFNYYKNLVRNTRKRARAARETERVARSPRRLVLVDEPVFAAQAREQRIAQREARRLQSESAHARREQAPPIGTRRWLEPDTD